MCAILHKSEVLIVVLTESYRVTVPVRRFTGIRKSFRQTVWLRLSAPTLLSVPPLHAPALLNKGHSLGRLSESELEPNLPALSASYLVVTLHPFLSDFLHWRTRRTHRLTTLCRACGHPAHAVRPSSCQFLMGLRVECIRMEEQLLLLENPLLKVLLLEDERSDWVNPIFDEREKCCKFQTLFPMLLEQAQQFFQYFRMGPGTFWYILHNINFLEFLRINHFLLI